MATPKGDDWQRIARLVVADQKMDAAQLRAYAQGAVDTIVTTGAVDRKRRNVGAFRTLMACGLVFSAAAFSQAIDSRTDYLRRMKSLENVLTILKADPAPEARENAASAAGRHVETIRDALQDAVREGNVRAAVVLDRYFKGCSDDVQDLDQSGPDGGR